MMQPIVLFSLALLVFFTCACTSIGDINELPAETQYSSSQSLLNSERIEATFGSYGIDVLVSDNDHRVSNLYSLENEHKVTRTLAIVTFNRISNPAIQNIHHTVIDGASLGTAFKKVGWMVHKKTDSISLIPIDARLEKLYQLMSLPKTSVLASHRYQLSVSKNQSHPYATITEIHSPDYLSTSKLESLYGQPAQVIPDRDLDVLFTVVQNL